MVDFNPSIPQGADNLSTSQGQLLNNFTQLNTIFATDHYTWNDATSGNRGLHKQVTFPVPLAVDPTPTGTSSKVYSKAVSGVTQLFFANSAGSTQLTGFAKSIASNGYITFPGGLIMQWGSATVNTSGTTVNFPLAFPANCWSVVITPESNTSRGIAENTVTTASFKAFAENNGTKIRFIAIGN